MEYFKYFFISTLLSLDYAIMNIIGDYFWKFVYVLLFTIISYGQNCYYLKLHHSKTTHTILMIYGSFLSLIWVLWLLFKNMTCDTSVWPVTTTSEFVSNSYRKGDHHKFILLYNDLLASVVCYVFYKIKISQSIQKLLKIFEINFLFSRENVNIWNCPGKKIGNRFWWFMAYIKA